MQGLIKVIYLYISVERVEMMEKGEVHLRHRQRIDYDEIVKTEKIEVDGIGEVEVLYINNKRRVITICRFRL